VTDPASRASEQPASPWQLVFLGVALALLVGFAVRLASIDAPLAHDEAVYAIGGDSRIPVARVRLPAGLAPGWRA
jgi:hypothetical protein